MQLELKLAIVRTRKTQRQIALDAGLPEVRLSELVRGRAFPSSTEREALNKVLGADYFRLEDAAGAQR